MANDNRYKMHRLTNLLTGEVIYGNKFEIAERIGVSTKLLNYWLCKSTPKKYKFEQVEEKKKVKKQVNPLFEPKDDENEDFYAWFYDEWENLRKDFKR